MLLATCLGAALLPGAGFAAAPAPTPAPAAAPAPAPADATQSMAMMSHAIPTVTYTLRTGIANGKMVYIGRGGDIDGKVNPTLTVHEGDVVQITVLNGEGAEHDIVVPDLHV